MQLAERTKLDLKSFNELITSIANGTFDEGFAVTLLNSRCANIRMDAEISSALYPGKARPYLKLYFLRLNECLEQLRVLRRQAKGNQLMLLNVVYGKLYGLAELFKELLGD